MVAFPILKLVVSIPSLGLYNQLFSNWWFLLFCFFSSTSYWYCLTRIKPEATPPTQLLHARPLLPLNC